MKQRLCLAFALAAAGCASAPKPLSDRAKSIAVVDKLPADGEYVSLGPIEAGLSGLSANLRSPAENREALKIALRNRAADLDADVVVVSNESGGAALAAFQSMKGIAYRKKGRAPSIAALAATAPPLPDVPAAQAAPAQPAPVQTAPAQTAPAPSSLVQESPAQAAPPPVARALSGKLAVLDFKNYTKDLQPEQVRYFTDVVRSAAVRAGPRLEVMTRENLIVLMQAQGRDLAACQGECEVETGRLIGADLIVSGDLQRIGKKLKLSMRLHETHGGRLMAADVASGRDLDELDTNAQTAAASLLAGARQ